MEVVINSGERINATVSSVNITAVATFTEIITTMLIASCVITPQIEIEAQITSPITVSVTLCLSLIHI